MTKKTLSHLSTEIKKEKISKLIKLNYFISSLFVIGSLFPFIHIFFSSEGSSIELFGFPNLRTLFFSLSIPVVMFTAGMFLLWIKSFINIEYVKTIVNFVSCTMLYTSFFFITWIFFLESPDFNPYLYYACMIVIAGLGTCACYIYSRLQSYLHEKISFLIMRIFKIRTDYYFPIAARALRKEGFNQAYKEVEKFDDFVGETLEEVSK